MNTKMRDDVIAQSFKLMNLFLNNGASKDTAYSQGWRFIEDFINRGSFSLQPTEQNALKIDLFDAALRELASSRVPLSN